MEGEYTEPAVRYQRSIGDIPSDIVIAGVIVISGWYELIC